MTHSELGIFYKNIAGLYSAGIAPLSLFESLSDTEKNTGRRAALGMTIRQLRGGRPLTDALRAAGLVPVSDLALIHTGEKSGKLLHTFETLAREHEIAAEAERHVRAGLLKPFLSLAFALFVPSLPGLFTGKTTLFAYLLHTFGVLLVLGLAVVFAYRFYMRSLYETDLARSRYRFFQSIPYLSGLSRKIALESFTSSLALMLEAGLTAFDAIELAGRASANPGIFEASQRIVRKLKGGQPLFASFLSEPEFSDDVKQSLRLGSESGQLPAFLQRSSARLKTEINAGIDRLGKAIPMIIYWCVMIYMAWIVIDSQLSHMQELNDALKE